MTFIAKIFGFIYFHYSLLFILNRLISFDKNMVDLFKFLFIGLLSTNYKTIFITRPAATPNAFPKHSFLVLLISTFVFGAGFLNKPLFLFYLVTYLLLKLLNVIYLFISLNISKIFNRRLLYRRRNNEDTIYEHNTPSIVSF